MEEEGGGELNTQRRHPASDVGKCLLGEFLVSLKI